VIILVVTVVPTLVVVVCACLGGCFLVARVGMALFVQVLSVFSVHMTGLEILVCALRGALLVLLLVVVSSGTITKLGVLASAIALTMIAAVALHVQPVAPALVGKMAQLACILLHLLSTQLVLCFCANLLDLLAL
jgi:hypothetical protein